jgi:hypothetical protein
LGTILISRNETNVTRALTHAGVPANVAHRAASSFGSSAGGGGGAGQPHTIVHDVQLAFAHSTQTVFYIMAGIMAVTFIVTVRWLPRGRMASVDEDERPEISADPGLSEVS